MKIRKVRWRDSRLYITQEPDPTLYDVCVVESIGYVVREDKSKIVLAGDIVDGEFRRVIVIPKENLI